MNLRTQTRPRRRTELASARQHRKTGRPSRSRAVEGTRGQAELGFSAQGRRGGPEGRIFGAFMRLRTANRQEKEFLRALLAQKPTARRLSAILKRLRVLHRVLEAKRRWRFLWHFYGTCSNFASRPAKKNGNFFPGRGASGGKTTGRLLDGSVDCRLKATLKAAVVVNFTPPPQEKKRPTENSGEQPHR